MNRRTKIVLLITALATGGCEMFTPSTSPSDPEARQDAIMTDPMGADLNPPPVAGGGFMDHLDDFLHGH